MLIKRLDFLSPPITFYHKGYLSHSSIMSGIISIISIIIILILAIYFSLDIIERKDPKAFSYNSFVEDAGQFSMNSTSIFHFISMSTIYSDNLNDGIDFTNYRIIGMETYFEGYLGYKNLSLFDHWLYGLCNNETDTEGIGYLINQDYFEKSACIKKFFSVDDQKYYDKGDPKFRWPEITKGTYQKDFKIYNVFIERCQEDTISLILGDGKHCRDSLEFEQLFENVTSYGVAYFYFINHYIDVLNYENPNRKFIYTVEGVLNKEEYSINHLNFNPCLIKTHNGLIFDNIEEKKAHIYERNDVFTAKRQKDGLFTCYIFWLKNAQNYHERTYKRIQDVISSIGGFCQFVLVFASVINLSFNNYIVLSDTELLLNTSIHREKTINKYNELESQNLRKMKQLQKEKIKNKIKKSSDRNSLENTQSKNINDKNIKENINSKSYNICKTSYENINISKIQINLENNKDKNCFKNGNNRNQKNKSFCNFLLFKFTCGKNDNSFRVYDEFRKRMISEEHLIKNHLNIYNLLRVTERKRHHKRNSYQLNDLIKLI